MHALGWVQGYVAQEEKCDFGFAFCLVMTGGTKHGSGDEVLDRGAGEKEEVRASGGQG